MLRESAAETYLGPYQTSMMERFAKIVNGCKPLTIFAKRLHHRSLTITSLLLHPPTGVVGGGAPYENLEHFEVVVLA